MNESDAEMLLRRHQEGDPAALDGLCAYYLPRLQRWARRLRLGAWHGMTTDDFVQEAFLRAVGKLDNFAPRGPGSLFAYLRTIVINRVRDEARRRRLPYADAVPGLDEHVHPGPSPFDWILRREMSERCARAFTTLSPHDQEMIAAVVERPCTDRELAIRFGKPSAAAARMARHRLRTRLASALEA